MIINRKRTHTKTTILITLLASVCMLTTSLVNGSIAYGAEAPAGDENFNYNGYSATQLKNISECISGVIPASKCPAYEASSNDYYTGTVNHDNMPASGSIINTKIGWRKWADAAMKANSYDGVYGTLKMNWNNNAIGVKFRLIGINQDNRADGIGKAGLTFQAIGSNTITGKMNNSKYNNIGGWRDSILRKNLNDETGTIWNAIQSTDFKNNITPVLKTTSNGKCYNGYICDDTSNTLSITTDKLFILSPSEMGMPVIKNYHVLSNDYSSSFGGSQSDANVHYYDSDTYNNTIKSSSDGNSQNFNFWSAVFNYIYSGDTYQWWMLPAGSRKMSNGNQAYHNTDSYSYCALATSSNPSTNKNCSLSSDYSSDYWLRSVYKFNYFASYFSESRGGYLYTLAPGTSAGVAVSFSF